MILPDVLRINPSLLEIQVLFTSVMERTRKSKDPPNHFPMFAAFPSCDSDTNRQIYGTDMAEKCIAKGPGMVGSEVDKEETSILRSKKMQTGKYKSRAERKEHPRISVPG